MSDQQLTPRQGRIVEMAGGRRNFKKAGVAAMGVAAAGLLTQGEAEAQRGGLDLAVVKHPGLKTGAFY